MYIDLELHNQLQPYVRFDWRLIAERGLRCYGHLHQQPVEWPTVASCEICFLIKMSNEEQNWSLARGLQQRSSAHLKQQNVAGGGLSTATTTTAAASATSATRRAGQFKCVGAIRKAGFLSVKKWILKRRQSIELARKQGWKRYWVCLRGTALLFHAVIDQQQQQLADIEKLPTDSSDNCTDLMGWIRANCAAAGDQNKLVNSLMAAQGGGGQQAADRDAFVRGMAQCYIEREPRHLIIIEGAIAQPIPEHPKRDHVFCLSTTFGDAYLFQASCQLESDNWISAMHNACAASLARDLTRDEAMKLFEAKVRRLELEAEKKLFLRQRLESRLTTMSSIGASIMLERNTTTTNQHKGTIANKETEDEQQENVAPESGGQRQVTMRSLLHRLGQQLVALDTYLEQVHCEIYQLRCYLCSCNAQQIFYHTTTTATSGCAAVELPHPRSLLMHVSKPTKVMLIKLGVFTVSSFHAYIHARQGSAESILQKIQQQQQAIGSSGDAASGDQPPLELPKLNAQFISERLISSSTKSENQICANQHLESDTEQLIDLTNLRAVTVRISKSLYKSIRGQENDLTTDQLLASADSDDRQSIQDGGECVIINLKLHTSSTQAAIIKQVLLLVMTNSGIIDNELTHLNYYLRLKLLNNGVSKSTEIVTSEESFIVAKRRETLNDWCEFEYLELMTKVIFKVQLTRRRLDEEASPFGIAVGAQLFVGQFESKLNVYCSYIEWGSVADKTGLRDDDELLVINGIPVMDLDMMFVECILHDEQNLRLIVRSCRTECPPNGEPVDGSAASWQDDGNNGRSPRDKGDKRPEVAGYGFSMGGGVGTTGAVPLPTGSSQVISDEYISSLVCPPPPAKSDAFLRCSPVMLRQKSDMGPASATTNGRLAASTTSPSLVVATGSLRKVPLLGAGGDLVTVQHTKSHQDLSLECLNIVDLSSDDTSRRLSGKLAAADQLAGQLLRKTGQLTRLLSAGRSTGAGNDLWAPATSGSDENKCQKVDQQNEPDASQETGQSLLDPNAVERLRKSILELLETEYAFIRHLETIIDHYMTPLEESSYLNIPELRLLSQSVADLISFQREFFDKLTGSIWSKYDKDNDDGELQQSISRQQIDSCRETKLANDDSEELNKIVQQLEMFKTIDHFKPLILSLADMFNSESDKFKIYAAYCVAYSKLQKFLHPKRAQSGKLSSGALIASIPNALDTFLTTNSTATFSTSNLVGSQQPREFFKPLGSFMANNNNNNNSNNNNNNCINLVQNNNTSSSELGPKLRQFSEFLGNLDSSSSSASLSLPKTSNSDLSAATGSEQQNKSRSPKNSTAAMAAVNSVPFQRSVHQQNFESYLIKPIQRIVKYPMLLNSIAISAQIYNDKEINAQLQMAVKQMSSTTGYVNDAQKVHDEYNSVFEHIERLWFLGQQQLPTEPPRSSNSTVTASAFGAHQPPISLAIDQLLYFGSVAWLNINDFRQGSKQLKNSAQLSQMLFVFKSCVVFVCKEQVKLSNKKRFSNQSASNVINNLAGSTNIVESGNSIQSITNLSSSIKIYPQKSNNSNINLDPPTSFIIKYQTLIPVSEVQVRSVPTSSNIVSITNQQHQFQWELFRCSSVNSNSSLLTKSNKHQTGGKVYLLSSATNETRNAFLRKIRFIIRESVRNMSLPLARSPSSKSLTPKKISSPSLATNTNSSCSTSLSPVCDSGKENNCKTNDEKEEVDRCEFGANQVCDRSYKTSIEVIN